MMCETGDCENDASHIQVDSDTYIETLMCAKCYFNR